MPPSLGILFLHHDTGTVAKNNLRSVQFYNPEATVVTMSGRKAFNGGYSLDSTPALKRLHSLNVRRGSDWLVCSWFLQRREQCDKWWIIEWDTYCGTSAQEYYWPVWDFPFVASSVQLLNREPSWFWFKDVEGLPEDFRPHAMGAVPFLYLLSDRALTAICKTLLAARMVVGNGELRFATAARKAGFPPCGYSPPNDQITWINHDAVTKRDGISHPVKFRVPQTRASRARA